MITHIYRLCSLILVSVALFACAAPEPAAAKESAAVPLGVDLGGSGPVMSTPQPLPPVQAAAAGASKLGDASSGRMQMARDGRNDVHATGTVNSVDAAQHKVNLSHQPIPEIGWPAMTMDFAVAPNVDLHAIKPGARVDFTMQQGQGGMYEIHAVTPAGVGK